MQKEKLNIINLGCRLNIYEGEVIKSLASKNELDNFTIINSCAVTQKAEKKVNYEIRKAKKNSLIKKLYLLDVRHKLAHKNMLQWKRLTMSLAIMKN